MTNEALLDTQTQKIIKKYISLYRAIFQYSIFMIPLILGAVYALSLGSTNIQDRVKTEEIAKKELYTVTGGIYTANGMADNIGPIFEGRGDIKILGGILKTTGGNLIGYDNLVVLNGIILPKNIHITDITSSTTLDSFTGDYDVDILKQTLNNWILTSDENSNITYNNTSPSKTSSGKPDFGQENLYPLIGPGDASAHILYSESLIDKYNLGCMSKRKLYDGFCNKNISSFINNIPSIGLERSREEISKISNLIKKESHKDAFCTNIIANVLKNEIIATELDNLMNSTCSSYYKRYSNLKDFIKVNNELASITSDAFINGNLDVNLYKLVSLQQKISLQYKNSGLDLNTVKAYLGFVNSLFHQNNLKIPQFYINSVYYFNNTQLRTSVKNLAAFTNNTTTKSEITNILDQISSLNRGNSTIGIMGLEKMVKNNALVNLITGLTGSVSTNIIVSFDQVFRDTLNLYPEIRIQGATTNTENHTAQFSGYLRYTAEDKSVKNIMINALFAFIENKFVVQEVNTPQNAIMNNLLQQFTNNNSGYSLSDIITIIKTNGEYIADNITLCDVINLNTKIVVKSCNDKQAIITANNSTTTLTIANELITHATNSNPEIQTYLDSTLSQYGSIGQDRLLSVLEYIASYKTAPINTGGQISSIDITKLAVIAKFKSFLGVEPTDIVYKNNKWIVLFSLKGYSFATVINISSNYKISPLVIEINGKIITINDFSLTLIQFSQNRITSFIDDPLNFIKSIDANAYSQIHKALGE